MYKDEDFSVGLGEFRFKKDSYPISKINNVRVKRLSLLDNLGQILFWVFVFSGAVWLAIPDFETAPLWLKAMVLSLSLVGFVFSLFRCSKYALQIEFRHIDETGVQWVNVAKSYSEADSQLFEKQVQVLREQFV
ncbi:hypothetical protein [Vibrio scophthalmi]|uniref:Uncharacterized protein n=1 Tax=Vibrio scophthalmi LMG 19158 TaxID=870967 RepID=F9RJ04_9VIBR|nr:hypothetical protein [Vibrio scophthalmi]EGU41589.1 hypothetical protein VIS19158_07475 [Vibrio scophthalmi LMG 19158]